MTAFKAVSELVKSWSIGDYVYHVRHIGDKGSKGLEFLVIFSIPEPTLPVPSQCANATFLVKLPEEDAEESAVPKISYTVETQQQRAEVVAQACARRLGATRNAAEAAALRRGRDNEVNGYWRHHGTPLQPPPIAWPCKSRNQLC